MPVVVAPLPARGRQRSEGVPATYLVRRLVWGAHLVYFDGDFATARSAILGPDARLMTEELMSLDETLERFRAAANAMARGNPEEVKAMYSGADDVTLANPFGHAVRGTVDVEAALGYVSSRFSGSDVTEFNNIARYETGDLATFLDVEQWRTRVGGATELSDFDLRVSSTYRQEDGEWRLVHRHADPISSFDEAGPIRRRP